MRIVHTIGGWTLELHDAATGDGDDHAHDWLFLRHPDRPVEYRQAIDPGVLDWLLRRKDYTVRVFHEADGGHPLVVFIPPDQHPLRPVEFQPLPFLWACGQDRFGDRNDLLRADRENGPR